MALEIEVKRINQVYSLSFINGDSVLDEIIIPADLARSLRSALEQCISGRRQNCRATAKLTGYRLPPHENKGI